MAADAESDDGDSPSGKGLRFRAARLAIVIALAIVFLLMVFAIGERSADYIAGLLAIGLALVALHVWIFVYRPTRVGERRRKRRARDVRASNGHVDVDELLTKAVEYVKDDIGATQAKRYIEAIVDPSRLRGRVVETVRPLNRTVRQKVAITLEVPKGDQDDLYFPLMLPLKGELQDDLQISLDGSDVATLNHAEYLLLTVGGFFSQILDGLAGIQNHPVLDSPAKAQHARELRKLAEKGMNLIAVRARLSVIGKTRLDQCVAGIESTARLFENGSEPADALLRAAGLVKILAGHYAIVAVVPGTPRRKSRRIITYERYQIPSLKRSPMWNVPAWLKDRLAALIGSRPIYLRLELHNAATAKSYHLLVEGPEGTYAAVQQMPDHADAFTVTEDASGEAVAHPYRRLQRRRGQRYLHVYMRSVSTELADNLWLSAKFYEVPPGSIAISAAAASSAFLLIYLIAAIADKGQLGLGANFPAIVLAFPAAAGAFAGFEARSTGLVGGTLVSRVSSLLTVTLVLSAAGLFEAQVTKALALTVHPQILGVHDTRWQVLTIVSLFNAVWALYAWFSRTTFFYLLADRPNDQPGNITWE
ncbi:hypothetical protein [Amycolatopsis eburnea]|uniref:Uncharacterized protein n=1 Tax=Amycolatopsis eburnea TaxID=2267691 RepID=A0A427SYT1_9PSEU|nr:hypothetical protein [Amycolatopsis eburnea]RSD10307.1 hypothetical protein EIY87_36100 [Amycolatopsis eburnea]